MALRHLETHRGSSAASDVYKRQEYTVFGRIVEGMDIIDKIASVQTGQADKPVEDIPMTFKVDRIRKEEITKKYGYNYPE